MGKMVFDLDKGKLKFVISFSSFLSLKKLRTLSPNAGSKNVNKFWAHTRVS